MAPQSLETLYQGELSCYAPARDVRHSCSVCSLTALKHLDLRLNEMGSSTLTPCASAMQC
eukprot:2284709-Rhodomonas_salina.2